MKTLLIVRGLPGSGKSSAVNAYAAAERAAGHTVIVCSADDHFVAPDGTYRFSPSGLGVAHAECQCKAITAMADGAGTVVIDNTNSQCWEWSVYVSAAQALGYQHRILDLYDGGCTDEELATRNTHGVPVQSIMRMRARWDILSRTDGGWT